MLEADFADLDEALFHSEPHRDMKRARIKAERHVLRSTHRRHHRRAKNYITKYFILFASDRLTEYRRT